VSVTEAGKKKRQLNNM